MNRRQLLKTGFAASALLLGGKVANLAQDAESGSALQLKGAIQNVHDPVVIKQDDSYYLISNRSRRALQAL